MWSASTENVAFHHERFSAHTDIVKEVIVTGRCGLHTSYTSQHVVRTKDFDTTPNAFVPVWLRRVCSVNESKMSHQDMGHDMMMHYAFKQ
jgi:hypothetical protein